jgi:hypothetical protein
LEPDVNDEEFSYPMHMVGSITTLPPEPEVEAVRRLHEVVAEVTGQPVDEPAKPRIGFLP